MRARDGWNLFARYVILLFLGVGKLKLFYLIFTPLTVYPVFWLSKLFDASALLLESDLLFFRGIYAQIIPACVAGAAYYLLLILNLSTPMKKAQRAKSVLFLFSAFLIINIFRITAFIFLAEDGFSYFDIAHKMIWYLGSTAMLVIIWFVNVRIFKIEKIPVYHDFMNVLREIK